MWWKVTNIGRWMWFHWRYLWPHLSRIDWSTILKDILGDAFLEKPLSCCLWGCIAEGWMGDDSGKQVAHPVIPAHGSPMINRLLFSLWQQLIGGRLYFGSQFQRVYSTAGWLWCCWLCDKAERDSRKAWNCRAAPFKTARKQKNKPERVQDKKHQRQNFETHLLQLDLT